MGWLQWLLDDLNGRISRVRSAPGHIIKDACVKEPLITCPLAEREHDAHALTMELSYGSFQQLALHDIAKAGAIAQAHPWNACKGGLCIGHNAQYRCR